MKALFALSLLFLSTTKALAMQDVYVQGHGMGQGYCRGGDSFCMRNVEESARRYAAQDAQRECNMRQGQSLTYTLTYNTFCNPVFIPVGQDGFMNCNSTARMTCSLR